MKIVSRSAVLFSLLLCSVAMQASVSTSARDHVVGELNAFLASEDSRIAVSDAPEARAALRERIKNLTDSEVAEFQTLMAAVPEWKSAPSALSAIFPADTRRALKETGADLAARGPKAQAMRKDMQTLVGALKVLPEEKLAELGIDRTMVASLENVIGNLSPLHAAALEKEIDAATWQQQSAAAMASMSPAMRQGAWALASHGPLTKEDIESLEAFRNDLLRLLNRVDRLPEQQRKELKLESIRKQAANLAVATHDVVFMVRSQIPPESLQALDEMLDLFERAAALSSTELRELESFRSELLSTFRGLTSNTDTVAAIESRIGGLQSSELLMLRDGMDFEQFKVTGPALYGALTSPGFAERVEAARNPSPQHLEELESFRQQAIAYVDAAMAQGVDRQLSDAARKVIAEAPPAKLEFIRAVAAATPSDASPAARLRMVANDISLNCVVSLGSVSIPIPAVDDPTISLGSIDFNWICDPIENAINAVDDALEAAVDALDSGLRAVISAVELGLQASIDVLDGILDDITGVVDDIWAWVQEIPDKAWTLMKAALEALLDFTIPGTSLTIGQLATEGFAEVMPHLQSALNLTGNWWNGINGILPDIPCPVAGTSTPFGTVGSEEAALKHAKYRFVIDKIVGMIPDTEVSLFAKIPAQILYAGWEYLGICLDNAAAAADSVEQTVRYNSIITTSNENTTTVIGRINSTSSTLTSFIGGESQTIQNLINTIGTAAMDLELQLQIELNLHNQGAPLAVFQLPAPHGYLELARAIVEKAVASMLATGQGAGQAEKFLASASRDYNSGQFKSAYRNLQLAYQQITK